jgi:flagellar biosynthesis protein FlhF
MEYFIEEALTYTECLNKIRLKYGEKGVTILSHRNVRIGGFFGLFAKDGVEISGYTSNKVIKAGEFQSVPESGVLPTAVPKEEGGRSAPDFEEEKRKLLEAANRANPNVNRSDPTLQKILMEMQELKERLSAPSSLSSSGEEHESISRIRDILTHNDFSPSYTQRILERIKKEFPLDKLNDFASVQDTVLEWIGESITLFREAEFHRRPRIMVLVGPTGVGKTTTIAKLAAVFRIGTPVAGRSVSVRMITIDAYRIGAKQQLESFGNIMQIPVSFVDNHEDLRKTIALYSEEVELILVDTIGRSPRDSVNLGKMRQILDACGTEAETYLTVSAAAKVGDLKEIMRQFEPFGYHAVIITKLDETTRVGNVISSLSELGKSIFYITDGQNVPKNIQKATVVRFLTNLEGFQVNRAKIEERFPNDESEQLWRK